MQELCYLKVVLKNRCFFSAILFAWFFGFVLHKYTNLEMTGSLYELDESPRRKIHLKPLALAASNLIAVSKGQNSKAKIQESPKGKAKRRAPSPPPSDHEDFQRGLSPRGPPPPPTSNPPVPQPHSLDGIPHGVLVGLVEGDSLDYVEGHQLSETGLTLDLEDFSSEGEEEMDERELGSGHEALGAKLSASLRQTFHLK